MADLHGPYRNARFLLQIDGIDKAGFSQATIAETSTEPVEYREGNEKPTMRKLPNLTTYGNLSLQWGTTADSLELFEWRQLVELGQMDQARRDIAVVLLDVGGEPSARWNFTLAWPTQYDAPDLDASGNEVAIESMEIAHEGMERVEP
ncbi:phage tail protein [Halogeometricum limi]|uniref:Conserved hypothetical phage tail region protein n=1 Tax=Halogeometricum limi TaxID=555875 RepID=A0A1I6IEP2_9EURY|nr:phage tail protein [Halogeometricum limi]SFR65104.1 conserved hypothetical phage tail region protein [Halogeometricum limi]